ncbi:MAG: helix-turn-helix transcriptional regulator [Lachnospiraceae bacterium]|nr:helix-turn-helix transcriptional regulator [Lachnospiraceae bacterium]
MAVADNLKRGSVELLLLTLLSEGDMYGYQLTQELEQRSHGLYVLQETSMYPMLYRMVDKGLISDRQEKVGKRRVRVYYHLEDAGKEYLREIRKDYFSICRGILHILNIESLEDMCDE